MPTMNNILESLHLPHRREDPQQKLHELASALQQAQQALAGLAATSAKSVGEQVVQEGKEQYHQMPSFADLKHGFERHVDSGVKSGYEGMKGAADSMFPSTSSKPFDAEDMLFLIASIALPVLLGYFVSQISKKNVKTWYRTLKKPWWQPPSWVFPPLYATLAVLQGVSSWLVGHHGGGVLNQRTPFTWYAITQLLSLLWPINFFGGHRLGFSLLNSVAALFSAVATASSFGAVKPLAGYLFWPYAAWLAYATLLNFKIVQDNKYATRVSKVPADSPIEEHSRQTRAHRSD